MADFASSKDGTPIAFEVHGDGAALVFVHGWSCDRRYWAGQIEPFSREFTVVVLDLAGHGDSGCERVAWTMEAFGNDVAAVVERLGLERVVLIGHSIGGGVIVEAARQMPGRVAGLVWVDAYKQLRTLRTAQQVQEFLGPFRDDFVAQTRAFVRDLFPASADPRLCEHVAADMSEAPREVALAVLQSAKNFDREVPLILRELRLPVFAINRESPANDLVSMNAHGVEVVTMSGAGHFLMMEDAARFNSLLRSVVAKIVG